MSKVLVLEAHRHSLPVVRSLKRAGYHVIAGIRPGRRDDAFLRFSNGVDQVWEHPAWEDPSAFASALQSLTGKFTQSDPLLIFPVGETAIRILSHPMIRALDRDRFMIVAGDLDLLLRCLNKEIAHQMALSAGLPLPKSAFVNQLSELTEGIQEVGYPCVVKPCSSESRLLGEKCVFLNSDEARREKFSVWPRSSDGTSPQDRLVVQERIEGYRHNCIFLASSEGKILRYFESKVIRTHERNGSGYGTEVIAVTPSKRRRELCEKWVAHIGFEGIGCLQFLVNEEGGETFLEFNPRLDATIMLPWSCGFNFPLWAVQLAAGDPISSEPREPISANTRYQWLAGDLQGWIAGVTGKKVTIAESLRWFRDIVATLFKSRYHATWSWGDPLPSVYLYLIFALSTGKRLVMGNRRKD